MKLKPLFPPSLAPTLAYGGEWGHRLLLGDLGCEGQEQGWVQNYVTPKLWPPVLGEGL